eukprot:6700127-Pyramimonas_sp.AAC.1
MWGTRFVVLMWARSSAQVLAKLNAEAMQDPAVQHAMEVRSAVVTNNWVSFMRLYPLAPNEGECLLAMYLDTARFDALKAVTRGIRPSMPVAAL